MFFLNLSSGLLFVATSLLHHASCQGPSTPTGTWTTLSVLTTTFTAPQSCWTPEAGAPLAEFQTVLPEIWFYVNCTARDLDCCPPEYPADLRDPIIEPLYAPGFCPERHGPPRLYSLAGGNGERVRYCCPLSFTLEDYGTEPFCASRGSPTTRNPSATDGIPAVYSNYSPVHVAKPIFIINAGDMLPSPTAAETAASPSASGNLPGTWNANGLKVGIALAVSVPVIAILAFVCRVYIFKPRARRSHGDGGERGNIGNVAAPAYALQNTSRRRASQCGDGDSILTEPPPPYAPGEAPPRASGEQTNTPGIRSLNQAVAPQPSGQEQQNSTTGVENAGTR